MCVFTDGWRVCFVKPVELSLRVRVLLVLLKLCVTVCVSPLTFPLSLCRCRSCCGWIDCPRECCCVPQRSLRLRNGRILRQRDRKRHTRSKTATVKAIILADYRKHLCVWKRAL